MLSHSILSNFCICHECSAISILLCVRGKSREVEPEDLILELSCNLLVSTLSLVKT
jgi:hypothetical protein